MATGGKTSTGWQGDLNVCERNWYMFENELETNVTFQVSSPLDGKTLCIILVGYIDFINIFLYERRAIHPEIMMGGRDAIHHSSTILARTRANVDLIELLTE